MFSSSQLHYGKACFNTAGKFRFETPQTGGFDLDIRLSDRVEEQILGLTGASGHSPLCCGRPHYSDLN
jgi:hypothetical protein